MRSVFPKLPREAWPNAANLNLYRETWQSIGRGAQGDLDGPRTLESKPYQLGRPGRPGTELSGVPHKKHGAEMRVVRVRR